MDMPIMTLATNANQIAFQINAPEQRSLVSDRTHDPHRYTTSPRPVAEGIAPVITEVCTEKPHWVPETHYLTIVDPTRTEGEKDFTGLMVLAHHRRKDEEVLIDFRSNNTSFQFLLNALRRHFDGTMCFVESWEPSEDEANEPF